jgi:hypothetical protein
LASEEEIWCCSSCGGLEFDLEDENIEVVFKNAHSAVILLDGRAHSLVRTTFEKAKRRKEIEDKASTVCPYSMKDPIEEFGDLRLGEEAQQGDVDGNN